ncbi:hypothetical protein GYH30_048744 [Glycine max]|uniref:Aminotransferase class I/classII large domain-containing protein n=2 Tax=Glycine subgen. Soja TaxID=1462606 RepID=K7MPF4_SOYBN|nr:hypothetical protein GYH30_048744 [Glycine max]RZB50239.1 Bifunctional aspartate aminotransferase and glutamate/aspartate-prephenate aminotransferase [Glycine soja]
MWDRTPTVNGFSKTFAMTGWRLGYIACPKHFVAAFGKIQSQFTSGASSISQKAGVAALGIGYAGGEAVSTMYSIDHHHLATLHKKFKNSEKLNTLAQVITWFALVLGSAFGDDSCIRISYDESLTNLKTTMERIKKALIPLSSDALV